eukprot:354206-Chlamydomonas_euryale.AAC.11
MVQHTYTSGYQLGLWNLGETFVLVAAPQALHILHNRPTMPTNDAAGARTAHVHGSTTLLRRRCPHCAGAWIDDVAAPPVPAPRRCMDRRRCCAARARTAQVHRSTGLTTLLRRPCPHCAGAWIDDASVSRQHAVLVLEDGGAYCSVRDLGSVNKASKSLQRPRSV